MKYLTNAKYKPDWQGLNVQDAYRPMPYYLQFPANKMFFNLCTEYMGTAARFVCPEVEKVKTKPQIVFAFVPDMPQSLRAPANLGLSAFCAANDHRQLDFKDYLGYVETRCYTDFQKKIFNILKNPLDIYLLFRHLKTQEDISSELESYRLVAASSVDPKQLVSLAQVVNAAILFGDLFPYRNMGLSKTKQQVFYQMNRLRKKYEDEMIDGDYHQNLQTGAEWMGEALRLFKPHFQELGWTHRESAAPRFGQKPSDPPEEERIQVKVLAPEKKGVHVNVSGTGFFGETDGDLTLLGDTMEEAMENAGNILNQKEVSDLQNIMKNASLADDESSGVDPMRLDPFTNTKYEDEIVSGGKAVSTMINGQKVGGNVFEYLLPASREIDKIDELMKKSEPLEKKLRAMVFQSTTSVSTQKLTQSGPKFHPNKLVENRISDHIFLRNKYVKRMVSAKPLITIICDASGSMSFPIDLCKIVVSAFIRTSAVLKTDLLAAAYGNDGKSRIDYLYNENLSEKNRTQALSRLVSAQTHIGQQDALGLTTVLQHARKKYGKSKSNYIIYLTDEGFGKSFPQLSGTATHEVCETLRECKDNWFDQCHISLFTLSRDEGSPLHDLVDKLVRLPSSTSDDDLEKTAEKLGVYVASLVLNQNHTAHELYA